MPVWLITGCSTGSRELAREVLARGWHVAVTAGDQAAISDIAAVQAEARPFRLVFGGSAVQRIRAELDAPRCEIDAWEETAIGADYPTT